MNLNDVIKNSFSQYSAAVIQSRALVDVRDCVKPSARQIFYCMYTDKFIHSKPFQKTLKAIGSAMRIYIHGDASAEGIIMRAAQPFAMRYPLVEIEGNGGNLISSGNHAAPRYTSARLSKLTDYLFTDLEKNTIDNWRLNYDDTEKYPTVLPSKGFYNIVNGNFGIAVGASSSIPQYNLKEVNNALIKLIQNPNCSFDEIYCVPDFATGAILINPEQVKESHKNGTGFACKLRAVVSWDSKDRCFIVSEIPYMLYTETICKELEDIINSEENPGIERFNDLTGKTPLIKIYVSKAANPDKVLKYLYKKTSLESFYGINFTMLDNGRFPKVFTWKEMLLAHIAHEKEVYRRGFEFDLNKINDRLHIIEGILIALNNIEEVIKIIKESPSSTAAALKLQKVYGLDAAQTKAILNIKLSTLAHMEAEKFVTESNELKKQKTQIESILNDETLFNNELIKGWQEVSEKFGDARRTKILNLESDENDEPIEKKLLQLSITNENRLFVAETSTLYTQKRGGIGNKLKLHDKELVVSTALVENTDTILFFSEDGKYYTYNAIELPQEGSIYIGSLIEGITSNIQGITSLKKNDKKYILFITKKGIVKKSLISDYVIGRKGGTKAIELNTNDKVLSVLFINDSEKIGLLSNSGNFLIFNSDEVRQTGRITKGVKGMNLLDSDFVSCARLIPEDTQKIVSISALGKIKQTLIDEFTIQGRATKGAKIQKVENDTIQSFIPISNETELLVFSTSSCIKIRLSEVPVLSRGAQGVNSIKLNSTDKIITILKS